MITVLDVIKQVASLHGSVEYVGQGDVFGVSNETNIKYPAIWVDIVEGESDLNNLDPTYIIYYIDRVADDLSDALHKQNDSMYVLGDIMTEISNYYAFSTPIRVQPFREKFLDNCAGGWVQVKFTHCISALGIDSSISLDDKSLIPGRYVAYDSSMNIIEKVDSTTRSVDSILEDITNLTQQSITGLKVTDSPEFADTQITTLAAEATYTPTVWSYLVGLFTTVPKSALQHLVKLWGVVNNLAVRVGLLEDDYILKYVVPVDTTSIDLTTDRYGNAFNFVEGDEFLVIIKAEFNVNNRIDIRVNDISSPVYYWHSTNDTTKIITASSGSTLQFSEAAITIVDSEIYYKTFYRFPSNSGQLGGYTVGANISAITKIKLFPASNVIKAGTIIIIKKR